MASRPHVRFADADLDAAIPVIATTMVQNAGQTCSAGSRLLVERRIYDEAAERLARRFAELRAGHPRDGPRSGPRHQRRAEAPHPGLLRPRGTGRRAGAGRGDRSRAGVPEGAFFVEPRVYGPVPRGNDLACQEVFGPVLSVQPFSDEATPWRWPTTPIAG